MNQAPDRSPDILGGTPRGTDMRRLNRVPILIAGLILSLLMGAVAYTYHLRVVASRQAAEIERERPEAVPGIGVLAGAPDGGFIAPKVQPLPPPLPVASDATPIESDPKKLAWDAYHQRLERMKEAREQVALQAVLASTIVSTPSGVKREIAASPPPLPASDQFASIAAERLSRRFDGFGDREKNLNRAAEKRDFLSDRPPGSRTANTLQGRREDPVSPYDVKAGTVIPAIMIVGVSSDLPGQLIGQVAENVYDTATGRFILIPQGSKLIGTYDNAITTGQERVLVAWTRIIYPDASSLDLGKMPGADQGGYAGFTDRVNGHFVKTFGNAILLSVFSAGIQLSQGQGNNQTSGLTAQQTIAASLGQQLGQLGQETARRNLQVQPTLEIRPGYRFTVMVTNDLVLRPWRQ